MKECHNLQSREHVGATGKRWGAWAIDLIGRQAGGRKADWQVSLLHYKKPMLFQGL